MLPRRILSLGVGLVLLKLDLAQSFLMPNPNQSSTVSSIGKPSHLLPDSLSPSSSSSKATIYNKIRNNNNIIALRAKNTNSKEDKFSIFQRIESTKTAVLGLLSGGILATPFIALHDIPEYGGLASWEFDTDMGSLQSALFAIVYRYCVREEDDNDMLNMGVVGAFVVTRTLSRVRVPSYCTADPLGYFDYDMLQQLILNGLESVALFGGAALAMEFAYDKKWISKFPN